ncbi:hypothetical protein BG015_009262 [Linnemannia schmuckeri]|uniref:Uncharacterized protein n=1 Tax=Linnemannia schmuckeri TaxID=64567 RepID=A0A9P5RXX5_9FUNG|nr:hypothetical protein BG015_009262 [Linnemannia schmuckeri]
MNYEKVGDVPRSRKTAPYTARSKQDQMSVHSTPVHAQYAVTAVAVHFPGHHCGSQFSSSCEYTESTLYRCTSGHLPVVEKECGDGKCSANIKNTSKAGDDSYVDKCACQEVSVPVCVFSFPADCKYNNKTPMSCGKQGDIPVVSEICTSYCDVIASAQDVCAFDPCACRRVGDTYGKSFPANCGYLADSLYTCATNRTLPIKKSACQSSEICRMDPGGVDVCEANRVCDCVSTETVWTDRFSADCAKPTNSLATCPTGTVTACSNGCATGDCGFARCNYVDNSIVELKLVSGRLLMMFVRILASAEAQALYVDRRSRRAAAWLVAPCTTVQRSSNGPDHQALLPTNSLIKVVCTPLIATLNEVSANLVAAKDDLTILAQTTAPAEATTEHALRLSAIVQVDFRTLNFTTNAVLNSSLPDFAELDPATDYTGVLALYRNIAAAANTKATQTSAAITKGMTSQLATITSALENMLTTGDTTTLRATGQTFGALIGTMTGNFAKQHWLLPHRGSLIIAPLLAVLKALVINLQNGLATSIGGAVSIFNGILQMINIVSPDDQNNSIRDYLFRLVGLLGIPTECGEDRSNCTSLIQIIRMLTNTMFTTIATIPVAEALIATTLNPLINGALSSASRTSISVSYTALSTGLSAVEWVSFFGTIATPFWYMLEVTKEVADCLSVGRNTTTTTKLELSDGVEKMMLLGLDGQEQQQQQQQQLEMVEQPERMLAED